MAFDQIRQTARVDGRHQVILHLPNLAEGTEVQVTVEPKPSANRVSEKVKEMARKAIEEDEAGRTEPFPV
jgi:hypothetical protein